MNPNLNLKEMLTDVAAVEIQISDAEAAINAVSLDNPETWRPFSCIGTLRHGLSYRKQRGSDDQVYSYYPSVELQDIAALPSPERDERLADFKTRAIAVHVTAPRATRGTCNCAECGTKIQFYGTARPRPVCSPCVAAAKLKAREKEEESRFYRNNPAARYYCGLTGAPPKPSQYEAVLNWRNSDRDDLGLIAMGDSFTGKSTALFHLMREIAVNDWKEVLCVNSEVLNTIPKRAFDGTLGDLMAQLKETDALLIDDLDKVSITPRVASELWALVESRLRTNQLPLFITMNVRSKRDFLRLFAKDGDAKQIGLSVYNRLAQACRFIDFDV